GLAVIVQYQPARNFLISHYSSFYPELVPSLTSIGKPVLTFGSHSTAAFFYYLFFLINFETYKAYKNWSSLMFSVCYVGLGFALLSVTGVVLMSLASFQLLWYAAKRRLKLTLTIAVLASTVALFVLRSQVPDFEDWVSAGKLVSEIVTSPT